jgi:hypothetical protein
MLCHLSHFTSLVPLIIFPVRSPVFALGQHWTEFLLPMSPTSTQHHVQLVCWHRLSLTFCLSWPGPTIFPTSAFWVASVIGMHHYSQLIYWVGILLTLFGLASNHHLPDLHHPNSSDNRNVSPHLVCCFLSKVWANGLLYLSAVQQLAHKIGLNAHIQEPQIYCWL